MESSKVKRKLAAVISMDVKGYSRLMANDDVRTVQSLKECRELMSRKVKDFTGRVVDAPGDNLLSEFSSVKHAVECAVLVQKELLERNSKLPDEQKMEFRMGISLGDVIEDEDQLYGDGINLAARLEGLAVPGGICISSIVYEQVRNKLPIGFKYLGKKKVKNIPDPVPVYEILTDPKLEGKLLYRRKHDNPRLRQTKRVFFLCILICLVAGTYFFQTRSIDHPGTHGKIIRDKIMRLRLPDKPSIAVLPFMNMSGEKEQEYFSDGLTEDLITDLSKVSGLFVISRNSVFSYKGKNEKAKKIGRQLGVRYILEGSVRKVENRVRITAQLIDTIDGGHIWADRYDRDLKDIFSLQDEVRSKIVSSLAIQLTMDDEKRLKKDKKINFEAYDYYLRGKEFHANKGEQGLIKARQMFEKAIEIDPLFARAYAALGFTWVMDWIFGSNPDPAFLDQAMALGKKTLSLNPDESEGYALLASAHLWKKNNDLAIEEARKALELDPNNTERMAAFGESLIWAGRPDDGIQYVHQALRQDPNYPSWYLWNLGHAYYLMGDYESAVDAFERSILTDPSFWPSHVYSAICNDYLGNKQKVAEFVEGAKVFKEKMSLEFWEKKLPYKDADHAKEIFTKLSELGFH